MPEGDPGTTVTRDAWMVPFLGLLGYELIRHPRALEVDGLTFAVSHGAGLAGRDAETRGQDAENPPPRSASPRLEVSASDFPPVHIVGAGQELGRVPASGRPRLAPHSLVQEYLNRTEHVWGLVTNGLTLRLLRDCTLVRRQAYVEFDLTGIFEEQRFHDFAALYRLLHRTRLPRGMADGSDCLLEKYYSHSVEQGGRVRDRLRDGVEECIQRLANGFLRHPVNDELRQRLLVSASPRLPVSASPLSAEDLYRQILRLVYRFLFLLVSEDRGLLSPDPIYREHYGIARLRRLLDSRAAYSDHDDLWQSLRVLWKALSDEKLAAILQLAPLNGELFAPQALDGFTLSNRDLLDAFWRLAWYQESPSAAPRRVNYAALDVEELGSVYESLLDFHPAVDSDAAGQPVFALLAGSERKTTGSYYTPPQLVNELIQSALEPVIRDRLATVRQDTETRGHGDADTGGVSASFPEEAILSIRICDPACGSGHFLLAAARRLGKELARVRTGEDEPAPERTREATREVIAHCIYGVDKNPLAVDLCRVALWLESHTGGKPLTFLDHRIRCGDALVGVFDLRVLEAGIPDKAFEPLEGDDKVAARQLAKRNRDERRGQHDLFAWSPGAALAGLTQHSREVDAIGDDTPDAIRRKRRLFEESHADPAWLRQREACDLWTAAFFQQFATNVPAITSGVLADHLAGRAIDARLTGMALDLSTRYRFFHWPLEFPEVFAEHSLSASPRLPVSASGFDVVLSNPPWERVKLQEQEFFAARDAAIATAPNKAARARLIRDLLQRNPPLHREFVEALRAAAGASAFLRHSGRCPLTGRGDINTYAVFAETMRQLIAPNGRLGCIVPSGIATDDTTKFFFADLISTGDLVSLFSFFETRRIFIGTDSRNPFCLLTSAAAAGRGARAAEFAFDLRSPDELRAPDRRFTLSAADIALLNPNTRTCPVFRSVRDAELTKAIYRRVPVLVREDTRQDTETARYGDAERGGGSASSADRVSASSSENNPWGVSFMRLFDMSNDSHLFRTRAQLEAEDWRLEGNVFVGRPLSDSPPLPEARPEQGRRVATGERTLSRYLPLYEAKMIHHFDHRFGDYADKPAGSESTALPEVPLEHLQDPDYVVLPRYWVPGSEVEARLRDRWERGWLLGWRDICRSTDERTVIASVLPQVASGDTVLLMLPSEDALTKAGLCAACLDSFPLDFAARQKVGGTHLKYHVFKQLPVLAPTTYEQLVPWLPHERVRDWLLARVLELTYTAWDLAAFAHDCGYDGPPFRWDEARRFLLRCELDAAFFHLYLGTADEWGAQPAELLRHFPTPRDAAAYIMDTFPIVRRKDEAQYGLPAEASSLRSCATAEDGSAQAGEYRTKRVILEIYDALQRAIATGVPYETRLDPPPADPRVAHTGKDDARRTVLADLATTVRSIETKTRARGGAMIRLPLYDLRAAAGPFEEAQAVGSATQVLVRTSQPYQQGAGRFYFVAQVTGRSMEPEIPDGAYCLFRRPASLRNGTRVLVRRQQAEDPERGGRFVVKECRQGESGDPARLISLNPEFPTFAATEDDVVDAEWVETVERVDDTDAEANQ
ncbi:MAG: hypothetical protein HY699_13705 [Deltaproteobacteria bacterium]|nr:hypothetical protein [Deltaproteobacteria bacterium]